jgi:oligopeptide transport system substrate-binding protein
MARPRVPGAIKADVFALDVTAARQALADSSHGSAEHLPEITYCYGAGWAGKPEGDWLVAQDREHLGVEIAAVPLDVDVYMETLGSAETWPDLAFWVWTQDYPDPQNWFSISWTCNTTIY